jgi:hypothetical protein
MIPAHPIHRESELKFARYHCFAPVVHLPRLSRAFEIASTTNASFAATKPIEALGASRCSRRQDPSSSERSILEVPG